MTQLQNLVASIVIRLRNEEGQTMAEYWILVAVIALVVIATLPQLATPIRGFFTSAAQVLGG